ncbi:GNAT family N-acetyltransferase [Tenacibaculum sediminilitoris]|uniref:GNAT family N-acetyltransferase n=1 Tax=Tenacibaculum sediminilitoris TaxID=1820334 RepID=UPI003895A2FA
MIKISKFIQLKEIKVEDFKILRTLMDEIYKAAYSHFWKDEGAWYIQTQFCKSNLEKELLEDKTSYYFIFYKREIVGIFRILWNKKILGFENKKSLKIHRIYLHEDTQGKGVGKKIVAWLENKARKKQYELIWLDTMNEQLQAFEFYKKIGYQYHSHCFLDFELMFIKKRKISQIYKKLT